MPLLFRILAAAGSAMFAGVMLAIGVILGSYRKALPPADFLDGLFRAEQPGLRQQKAVALDQVSAKLDTWLLHNVRIALALAASVLGIVAVDR